MRLVPIVILVVACQQDRTPQPSAVELVQTGVAARRSVQPSRPRIVPSPMPIVHDVVVSTADPETTMNLRFRSPKGYPMPPTDEPVAYAAWLRALPAKDRRRVNAYCATEPYSYRKLCGGLGALHIPYRPLGMRVFEDSPGDPKSYFASFEQWQHALTPAQRRVFERECSHGEDNPSNDLCGDNTPLVVAFDDQPVQFAAGGTFAFVPGAPDATDWPTPATPWIALDRDGDGAITSGAELFGSATPIAGGTASNGFEALAELDANHDGRIDAADPAFAKLLLWTDRNGDQRSSADELAPLGDTIVSISLANQLVKRCDARSNCEGERASLTWRAAGGELRTGTVVDVYLPRR